MKVALEPLNVETFLGPVQDGKGCDDASVCLLRLLRSGGLRKGSPQQCCHCSNKSVRHVLRAAEFAFQIFFGVALLDER